MYHIKAVYRFVIFWVFHPALRLNHYSNPSDVGGYRGWFETPWGSCLVFIRDDGSYQYLW